MKNEKEKKEEQNEEEQKKEEIKYEEDKKEEKEEEEKKCWVKCSSNNIKDGYSDNVLNNLAYPMLPAIAFYHISK